MLNVEFHHIHDFNDCGRVLKYEIITIPVNNTEQRADNRNF